MYDIGPVRGARASEETFSECKDQFARRCMLAVDIDRSLAAEVGVCVGVVFVCVCYVCPRACVCLCVYMCVSPWLSLYLYARNISSG